MRLGTIFGLAVWRNRPIRYLIICGMTLIAAIVIGTAIMVGNLRDRSLLESERELKNTALILAEQIDRTFQGIDLVQSSVLEKIKSLGIVCGTIRAACRVKTCTRCSGEHPELVQIMPSKADGHLINFSILAGSKSTSPIEILPSSSPIAGNVVHKSIAPYVARGRCSCP